MKLAVGQVLEPCPIEIICWIYVSLPDFSGKRVCMNNSELLVAPSCGLPPAQAPAVSIGGERHDVIGSAREQSFHLHHSIEFVHSYQCSSDGDNKRFDQAVPIPPRLPTEIEK